MKKFFLFFLLLSCVNVFAQKADPQLLSYFKDNNGGACLVPVVKWVQYGIDSIGRSCGQFILAEKDVENILDSAKKRAGGGDCYDMHYIDSMLGLPYSSSEMLRFHISAENLEKLHIRLPDSSLFKEKDSCGANHFFVAGGKTSGGVREGFIDRIPFAMLTPVPNYKGANPKYQMITPCPDKRAGVDPVKTNKLAKTDTCSASDDGVCEGCSEHGIGAGWIIVLIPLFLFLVILNMFRSGLKDFRLTAALSENTSEPVTKLNPQYTKDNMKDMLNAANGANATTPANPAVLANLATLFPPTISVSGDTNLTDPKDFRPSSSRLIAFISGIILLSVALGMSSFYIYFYLKCGKAPNLTNLSGVLIALGLGMAPYALNKVAGAINNNKDTNS